MRYCLALTALLVAALPATAAETTLDTQGQMLYGRLSEAINVGNCDNIIAYGYEFKQHYHSYLAAHPAAEKRVESNLSGCLEAILIKNRPLTPEENAGRGLAPAEAAP